jgi:hypothetical protein
MTKTIQYDTDGPVRGQRMMALCPHCKRRRSFIVGLRYPGSRDPRTETAFVCSACYSKRGDAADFSVGTRVKALYPNEARGCGTVIEIHTDRDLKPLVVILDGADRIRTHWHYDQVEVIA